MLIVNLFDTEFDHSLNEDGFYTASAGVKPTNITYIKNQLYWEGVTLFTERHLHQANEVYSRYKVAWLLESPGVHPWSVEYIIKYENDFDFILTSNPSLLKRSNKYKLITVGSCRIQEENRNPVKEKTKICSIIASKKRNLVGHKLRHQIIAKGYPIDSWGHSYRPFVKKEEALEDYMFSICVMNISSLNYFTEILTDCFFVGTVPIFWGCPNISDFFEAKGIIHFSSIEDLEDIIPRLNRNLYLSYTEHILTNFNIAQTYKSTDNLVASVILENININEIPAYHTL